MFAICWHYGNDCISECFQVNLFPDVASPLGDASDKCIKAGAVM